ncbi:MAG: hypothetical protein ACXWRE_07370 [Pseudobdellovibrionaceae bacterium]
MKTALILLTLVSVYVLILLHDAGVFRPLSDVKYGSCQKIGPLKGPEDMALVGAKVIVSSDARSADAPPGYLFSYDLQSQKTEDLTSRLHLTFPFHPHGIDTWTEGRKTFVYVVNHLDESHTRVEVFELNSELDSKLRNELAFVKSIEEENFQSGNDLLAVGKDQFYLTSDFGTPHKLRQKFQTYFWQKTGYVTFYDGNKSKRVMDHLFFANGIAKGAGHKIFVASMFEKVLRQLNGSEVVPLEGAPDNINAYNGKIYIAAHPNLFALKKQEEDRNNKAPSKIIEWDGKRTITIYENKGDEISSASVALPVSESRILIGSVFDDHILDCTKSKP